MRGEDILRIQQQLESDRSNLDNVWELITKFFVPFRGEFFRGDNKTENGKDWREHRDVYDSIGIDCVQTLSSAIHGAITSMATQWFNIKFKDQALNQEKDAMEWIENCVKIMYQELQDSNFNVEINETYVDIVSYGETYVFEDPVENDNGTLKDIVFEAVPPDSCYFEADSRGGMYRFYRKFNWKMAQIIDRFGEDKIPPDVLREYREGKNLDKDYKVVMAVYPRPEYKKNMNSPKKLAASKRPFGIKYVTRCLGSDGRASVVELKEEGAYEMPVFIARWRKTSGSKHGNSPAMYALPTMLSLNQLFEDTFAAMEKVIDPANLVTQRGLLSDLDLSSGGLTVVRSIDDLKVYESGARFDVGDMQIERFHQQIRRIFFVDQLELRESSGMTAVEVNVRYETMQRLLGPTAGRIQVDILSNLIQRTFNILFRYGKFPPPPKVVVDSKAELDIVYTGPMARAQKSESVAAIERWVGNLAALSDIPAFEGIMDIPDPDKIATVTREMQGVPAELERSKSEIKKRRREREENNKRATQAQLSAMENDAGGGAVPPPEPPM